MKDESIKNQNISKDEKILKEAFTHLQTFSNRPQPPLNCDTLQCIPNFIILEKFVYYA